MFRFFLDCVQSLYIYIYIYIYIYVDDRGAQEESGGARSEPEL